MITKLQDTMGNLSLQIRSLEDAFYIRQKEMRESYLAETCWWKVRCEEKNKLIALLGRRIAQLCVTDIHGFFLDGILKEIEKVRETISTCQLLQSQKGIQALPTVANSVLEFSSPSSSSSSASPTNSMLSSPSPTDSSYFCPIAPPPRKRSSKKIKSARESSKLVSCPSDFTCESLCSYLLAERKRVMVMPPNFSKFALQSTV